MKKDALIRALEESRSAFLSAVGGLTDNDLIQTGVIGTWSIKDMMVHLNMWEAETVTLLFQARSGIVPSTLHFQHVNDDEQNARWYEQFHDRELIDVRRDYDGVRKQLIRRVSEFNDKELDSRAHYPWLKNHSLSELIWDYSGGHEQTHVEQIRQWRNKSG